MNEIQMQLAAAKDEVRCCEELNRFYGLTLTEADIWNCRKTRRPMYVPWGQKWYSAWKVRCSMIIWRRFFYNEHPGIGVCQFRDVP